MTYVYDYPESGCFLILDQSDKPVGTGFAIEGRLGLTCEHLLGKPYFDQRPERLSVRFADGSNRRLDVSAPTGIDVAVLTFNAGLHPLGLGHFVGTNRNEIDRLQVVGCAPNQQLRTEFAGQATRFDSGDRFRRMISFNNSQIGPGFSGGPVLDRWTGQVVGIIVGGDEVSAEGRFGHSVVAIPTQLILDAVRGASLNAGPVLSRYRQRITGSSLGRELEKFVVPRLSLASSGITSSAETTLCDVIERKIPVGLAGPSGLGKSTLLAFLACRYLRGGAVGTIPILFSLHRALMSEDTGDRARILDAARHDETFRAAGFWDDEIIFDPLLLCNSLDRPAVFLIDGVDEALRDLARPGARLLEDLIRSISEWGMSTVVAAREPRLLGLKDIAMPWYELLGFDKSAQHQFISRYPELETGTQARAKLSRLPSGILERPLLLKLAAEVLGDNDEVGSVKSLYLKYIESEIGRAIEADHQQQIVLLRLLQEFALLTWRKADDLRIDALTEPAIEAVSGALGVTRASCEVAFKDGFKSLSKARTLCWTHKGEIRWAHSSFQEFLAAQALISRTKTPTDQIVLDQIKEEQELIDVAAFAMALLSKPFQERLLDSAITKRSSQVLRGVAARAISFGVSSPKHSLAIAEGLLKDLRQKCKGADACALLWTTYSGETCWELERLLDVGGDAAKNVLIDAINRPQESLILLNMYVAVLGKMGAWDALRGIACNQADSVSIRIACLATLLDNSELTILTECAENASGDEFSPFIWDALRISMGLESARLLAPGKDLLPIELDDVEALHSRLLIAKKSFVRAPGFSINRVLARISSERPDLLSSLNTRLVSRFDLDRIKRVFETTGYSEIPPYCFDPTTDLIDTRLQDAIILRDSDEARAKLIGIAVCPDADEVTKVLAVSTLCNLGAVRALDLIAKHSTVTPPVKAAAHERSTRFWTLWANRLRLGVLNDYVMG